MNETHARELLRGSYELHVHTAPSHIARKMDDWDYAKHLDEYEIAGSIIKKHFGGTADRATLVNSHGGFRSRLFGAIALNWSSGGLNPTAVRTELLMGAKLVYLPTLQAQNNMVKHPYDLPIPGEGITVLTEDGDVKPIVYEIMDQVKEFNAVLCTGHISAEEGYKVVKAGLAYGCRMMVTHPESKIIDMPIEWQAKLGSLGAYIEKCWINVLTNAVSGDEMASRIRTVGVEHCVMSTDLGQLKSPALGVGLLDYINCMLEHGFSDEEIRKMNTLTPKEILGIKA